MASLKVIRKRIASVKNTRKITKAMKLVAGARLRRSQDAIIAARPYAARLSGVISDLSARGGAASHPLLARRDEAGKKLRVALLVLTSDRGLCGGFNSNVNRRVERFLVDNAERFESVSLHIVGKKGRDYFRRRVGRGERSLDAEIRRDWSAPANTAAAHDLAREIARELTADFLAARDEEHSHGVDEIYIVYNEFKSAISQVVGIERLLPAEAPAVETGAAHGDGGALEFKYEPSREVLLSHLVPLYVQTLIFKALLESIASEFGARMSAMDSATRNASELIGSLTLAMNRARQAAITKELMEIIGGAEALKG